MGKDTLFAVSFGGKDWRPSYALERTEAFFSEKGEAFFRKINTYFMFVWERYIYRTVSRFGIPKQTERLYGKTEKDTEMSAQKSMGILGKYVFADARRISDGFYGACTHRSRNGI